MGQRYWTWSHLLKMLNWRCVMNTKGAGCILMSQCAVYCSPLYVFGSTSKRNSTQNVDDVDIDLLTKIWIDPNLWTQYLIGWSCVIGSIKCAVSMAILQLSMTIRLTLHVILHQFAIDWQDNSGTLLQFCICNWLTREFGNPLAILHAVIFLFLFFIFGLYLRVLLFEPCCCSCHDG